MTVIGVRRPTPRKALIAMVIVILASLAWALVSHRWAVFSVYSALTLYQLSIGLRPQTVVSVEGIRRPWCRRSFLTWDDVTSIAKPEPGRPSVRLNLTGGKEVSLIDVPAAQSASIAAIGGKEVTAPPALPAAPPPPRLPTDEMRHAEVMRQAANLSAGWRRLAEESGRIRRPRP